MKAHLDFETKSTLDIKKTGVHRYAEPPEADIMCLGFAFDEEPPVIKGFSLKKDTCTEAQWQALLAHVRAGGQLVAHNAAFELEIWNTIGVKKYGLPPIDPAQIDCTMVRAYAMGLPGALENLAPAIGIEHAKDMKGHRLMLKMSQPKTRPKDGQADLDEIFDGIEWWDEPDQISRLYVYCGQDLVVERACDKRLLSLSPFEKALWVIDQRINNRGIEVDIASTLIAAEVVRLEQRRLDDKMRSVTNNEVASCKANVQLRKWIVEKGIPTEGVAKNDVIELLKKPDLPVQIRQVLEIRQESAKSSTAKLEALLNGVCSDGRLKGTLQFNAANTRRWGGRRFQPHNLPRPTIEQKEIEEVFKTLAAPTSIDRIRDSIEIFTGSPLRVISDCIRGFITARAGYNLHAVDFSAIEARVLAWLAQELSVLQIFQTHGKVYEASAAQTFNVRMEEILKDDIRRLIGKIQILSLGFGGGVGAFQAMAINHNVRMAPAFKSLWETASESHRERALKRWEGAGRKSGIEKQEWLASELSKLAWREGNPNIVAYWDNMEAAAIAAVRDPGRATVVTPLNLPPVKWLMRGSFLFCKLPSGGNLCYPYPKLQDGKTPWGSTKEMLTYMTEDSTSRKWVRAKTYGGSLVENVTQAVARDLLAESIVRAEEAGFPIVLHVHDEIVAELKGGDQKELERIASIVPPWASGLPIQVSGWTGRRYRK